jgi:hypothetical protein
VRSSSEAAKESGQSPVRAKPADIGRASLEGERAAATAAAGLTAGEQGGAGRSRDVCASANIASSASGPQQQYG